MNVTVRMEEKEEAIRKIDEQLTAINRNEPRFRFKKYLVEQALDQWINENGIVDGFVLCILVRGHVVEVAARTLHCTEVQIGRRGVCGELKTSGPNSTIV